MNIAKLRNSTAIEKVLEITEASPVLKPNGKDDRGAQGDKLGQDGAPNIQLTANSVSIYLQDIAASSCREIDALISDLGSLREKLVTDGDRIERDVVEFATLNQSVVRLTEVIADSVTHVKAPSLTE